MKKTWPEIWLEIAEAFWTPVVNRTKEQKLIANDGLCTAIETLTDYRVKGYHVFYCLKPFIGEFEYIWGWEDEDRILRAKFAEHMAGIPHEDFEEFIK